MHRSKLTFGLFLVCALMAAFVSTASAHAAFEAVSAVPTNSDQNLVLNVPNERSGDGSYNIDIQIAIPSGWSGAKCPSVPKEGWTCEIKGSNPVVVHYARLGPPNADDDDPFGFSVHTASSEGTFKFSTVQIYNKGQETAVCPNVPSIQYAKVCWSGDAQSPGPAPTLKTVQGPPQPTTPTTNPDKPTTTAPPTTKPGVSTTQTPLSIPGGGPVTTAKPGVTTTAIPGAPNSTTTSTTADPSGSTSIPEETTTTTSSTVVAVTGTGTVPGTVALAAGSSATDASGRPAASPSGGSGPLLGAIGVVVLAGMAGVLIFRKNLFGTGDADPAADGPEITPIDPGADPVGPGDAGAPPAPPTEAP
jgi:hypothetical protein